MAAEISPDLELVTEFIQSRHFPELWATPAAAGAWLHTHGLLEESRELSADDLRKALRLRAALNTLIADRDHVDDRTRTEINRAGSAVQFSVAVAADGNLALTTTGTAADTALATVVAALHRCDVRGESVRLKACRSCGFAFVDVTKNQSRVWCDMALCGSQTKARAYRRRKAAREQGSPTGVRPA